MKEKGKSILSKYNNLPDVKKKVYLKGFSALAVFVLTIVLLFTVTAAWYSNIVEVEEITFEVDSWGVDAHIDLDEEKLYNAAPGDIEEIPYKVDNNADRLVNIQFNAYKKFLPDFMQQRIYFYVDKQTEVNGETVDKVYIHDDNAYYYPLLGGQVVDNIPDEKNSVNSDPSLKWEWVYDLLGYYTVIATDEDGANKETAYIRPVQYTYENAQYDISTGELLNIKNADGSVLTLNDFVLGMIETDGLLTGTQTEEGFEAKEFEKAEELKVEIPFRDIAGDTVKRTYYEIYKDEVNGYGIYMYLCDYNEIAVNNKIDADIADGEKVYELTKDQFAILQLSCGQAMEYFIDVSSAEELVSLMKNDEITLTDEEGEEYKTGAYTNMLKEKNLWDDREHVIIRLGADMAIDPVILKDCEMMIDMNGHTITAKSEGVLFTLNPGSELKIYNGTIVPNGAAPFVSTGAMLILKDIMTESAELAAVNIVTNGHTQGSNIQLINCTWPENRRETAVEITEADAENNVDSFISIKTLADEPAEGEEGAESETTGEITE